MRKLIILFLFFIVSITFCYSEIKPELMQKAKNGDKIAQYQVGYSYLRNNDDEKAVKWFKKSAKQGFRHAQGYLASFYKRGVGVEKNTEKSKYWYKKAFESYKMQALKGDVYSQVYIGGCYQRGNGVKKNSLKAINWYKKAMKQGSIKAIYRIGIIYYGSQELKNEKKALKYVKLAAEKGYLMAHMCMGMFYEKGRIVEKDLSKSIKWYRTALNNEDAYCPTTKKAAKKKIEELEKNIKRREDGKQ